ncbi:hypothetical protein SAMN05192534_1036 [Alteribacillus persepolensis]|uniref:Uncharacterized protein n=1 Tax=Alteribacillus persepolensis TaxID=568899 RepID=A0A1G8AT82_9BACI|nr:hypothetical protein [Alteribacillus persepolensis]SDH24064.1 hypothetical protein SAMN05192534_1036 [Alteribacillus persepolensis]
MHKIGGLGVVGFDDDSRTDAVHTELCRCCLVLLDSRCVKKAGGALLFRSNGLHMLLTLARVVTLFILVSYWIV